MAEYNKKLEEEKSKESQPKPDAELTDKEKEEMAQKRAEENLQKLKQFDAYLKEAPKYTYNTNVYKHVTFALTPEEVKSDETLVQDLANFLKSQAIPKLLKSLQQVEGVPTDSESLEQTMHSHGINMRYLGYIYSQLNEKEANHLKAMIEKEAVMRSCKHIFNEYIRESNDTYLQSVISHLFNLLLAPFPMIDAMNEGKISYVDQTLQQSLNC